MSNMIKTKIYYLIFFILIFSLIGGLLFFKLNSQKKLEQEIKNNSQTSMELLSSAFNNNDFIPQKYTCDGEDINPPLVIKEVPEGTKSLVLIVDDPDAPMKVWVHWLVWNIPPSVKEIKEGEKVEGAVEGLNDFGRNSYGGPCPPYGTHHYHFKLYALNKTINLPSSSGKKDLEKAISGSIIAKTELIGLYQRKR